MGSQSTDQCWACAAAAVLGVVTACPHPEPPGEEIEPAVALAARCPPPPPKPKPKPAMTAKEFLDSLTSLGMLNTQRLLLRRRGCPEADVDKHIAKMFGVSASEQDLTRVDESILDSL